jgi:catechol 2,3-dioxygenase-like lactoylglutathione lyase family enzyme
MAETSLNLLVLRASDLEKSLAFYRALGLKFVQEQHGSGPVHYACDTGGMVIELYPGEAGSAPDRKSGGATMIGFSVPALDETLKALADLGYAPLSPPKQSAWGRRASVLDPDGRAVDISEPPTSL